MTYSNIRFNAELLKAQGLPLWLAIQLLARKVG